MEADFERASRVRHEWVLPGLVPAGLGAGIKGQLMAAPAGSAHSLCVIASQAAASMSAAHVPGLIAFDSARLGSSAACAAANHAYVEGRVVESLGFGVALIAGAWLWRRGRRAAAAGSPWRLRRALARIGGTRLRPGYIVALLALCALFAGGAIVSAVHNAQQRDQDHAYALARTRLATLALPASITRATPSTCGAAVCAHSKDLPPQLEPELEQLVHGKPNTTLGQLLPCPVNCPVNVYGRIGGYPVIATVFWHVIVVRTGPPPAGAIRLPRGHGQLFYLGSDVYLDAVQPNTNS